MYGIKMSQVRTTLLFEILTYHIWGIFQMYWKLMIYTIIDCMGLAPSPPAYKLCSFHQIFSPF